METSSKQYQPSQQHFTWTIISTVPKNLMTRT